MLRSLRTVRGVNAVEDESTLWDDARKNDASAFARLFDLHRDRVYRHALRLTSNVHDAEDVAAGAFFELWRRRQSVRVVDGSVLPWLLVTTTNLSRNMTRGLRRYRALLASLPRGEVTQSAEDAALSQMDDLRLASQVQRALEDLSPSDSALITLTLYEGLSPAEVASALGISDVAARTRLHRARSRMAEALGINTFREEPSR
jgi:RNA polymerase sigma factor (sigma-70 family)